MPDPMISFASQLHKYQTSSPGGLVGLFLRTLCGHPHFKIWLAATGLVAATSLLIGFFLPLDSHSKKLARVPKGPKGLPILGSFLAVRRYPELTLDRWAKRYGPIYSMWLGNQLFVIVSEASIAKDLLVTNGAVFSDRKEMFIKSQTVLVGRGITASPYDKRWRQHRRLASFWLNRKAVESYTHVLDFEARDMISNLHNDCLNGAKDINPQVYAGRCSLNDMLTITFGFRTDNIYHPMVAQALCISREFMDITSPVSNLVDFVPILQTLPLNKRSRARKLYWELVNVYGGLVKKIEKEMQSGGTVKDCLVKTMLQRKEKERLDELDITMLASAFMIGGVETTASIMQWFTALIAAHPHVQKRAQDELDRVVGRHRMPTIEDEVSLPYCRAIIKEVERCHNPFWLGTPHMASRDFVYGEHFLPRGTVVILNTWTIHHDPKRWKSPMEFDPNRYVHEPLQSASARLSNPYERDHWAFGAGRRICPGMLVAERAIWLTMSRMLWAFDLEQIDGKRIDLNEYDGQSGKSPAPFEIRLRPRFSGAREIIENEMTN